jgi:low temperature requirement protein LtrA
VAPPPDETFDEPELRVTRLELFFDLVFVFALTQLTAMLAKDLTLTTVFQVLFIFAVLWWMHGGYGWLTNALPPERTAHRLLLFLAMAGFLTIALSAPTAFTDTGAGVALGLGYLVVVLVHAGLFMQIPEGRPGMLRIAPFNVAAALLLVVAGPATGAWQYAAWAAALVLHVLTPILASAHRWFLVRPTHFVERYGLLVIIAFGESVVAIGIGAAGLPVDAALITAAVLGLALTGAMWWTYFGGDEDERAEQALGGAAPEQRAVVALAAYFYTHIPVMLGIVTAAAGIKLAIGHAFDPMEGGAALALGGGVALFLAGQVVFRREIGYRGTHLRAVAAVLAAATAVVGIATVAAWQLAALVVLLLAMLVAESRSARPAPHGDPRTFGEGGQ